MRGMVWRSGLVRAAGVLLGLSGCTMAPQGGPQFLSAHEAEEVALGVPPRSSPRGCVQLGNAVGISRNRGGRARLPSKKPLVAWNRQ